MLETEFLAIPYRKTVYNELGMSESSILNVHRTDGFGILTLFHLVEGFSQKKKMLANGTENKF